jgi:lauroyl/myristoyl acyltransferase
VIWWRRFLAHGVFWRHFLRWAVLNVPNWIEPHILGLWAGFFVVGWTGGRRAVMRNLKAIKPGSWAVINFFRAWRVFWNFAWTIDDNVRFQETRTIPDWEFIGLEHFESLQAHPGGAIILTAHMGSYDLGAHLFAETSPRRIVMVRAPEIDPQTRAYEEGRIAGSDALRVDFNTKAADLAFDLLHAVRNGELVAIQGDRVTPGIATLPATLFGTKTRMPAGPFALAMAARVPIYPLFVVRGGRRRYRLVTCAPITVERRGRDRDADLQRALDAWIVELERVIAEAWYQWFHFEPIAEAGA